MTVALKELDKSNYLIIVEGREIESMSISREVDGLWVFYDAGYGALPAWLLRSIADLLDELNESVYKELDIVGLI